MSQKRIAITGASGLVGSKLQQLLSRTGGSEQASTELTLLTRSKTADAVSSQASERIKLLGWEPSRGVEELERLEHLDAFVHLAGRPIGAARWSQQEKQRLRDSRVKATDVLVKQLCQLHSPPKVFLSASAVGYYGDCQQQIVDEGSSQGTGFLAELARDWERASLPLAELGSRVVHARLGVVLSEHGGALAKMLPLFRWGLGGSLGDGSQYVSWIHLEDCCRAMEWLLKTESATGVFNLVSPNPVTNRRFTQTLGEILSRPTFLPAPRFALRLALGKMADELLLSSCRAIPQQLLKSGFQFDYAELDQALRNLLAK